jgi:protein-L-isoaspartate(D-aspartate) O-methyltransferase
MTEALIEGGKKLGKVLEVGTGCGYQTAVLAPFVKKIYSIERIAPLAKRAKATLKELGINNVMVKHGDGTGGWKSQKPFDGILVAAAPLAVPEALFAQLANRGRLIVPVGPEGAQQLIRFTRNDDRLDREVLGAVAFVPMLGGTG